MRKQERETGEGASDQWDDDFDDDDDDDDDENYDDNVDDDDDDDDNDNDNDEDEDDNERDELSHKGGKSPMFLVHPAEWLDPEGRDCKIANEIVCFKLNIFLFLPIFHWILNILLNIEGRGCKIANEIVCLKLNI